VIGLAQEVRPAIGTIFINGKRTQTTEGGVLLASTPGTYKIGLASQYAE
jgi:hypothetical protein